MYDFGLIFVKRILQLAESSRKRLKFWKRRKRRFHSNFSGGRNFKDSECQTNPAHPCDPKKAAKMSCHQMRSRKWGNYRRAKSIFSIHIVHRRSNDEIPAISVTRDESATTGWDPSWWETRQTENSRLEKLSRAEKNAPDRSELEKSHSSGLCRSAQHLVWSADNASHRLWSAVDITINLRSQMCYFRN